LSFLQKGRKNNSAVFKDSVFFWEEVFFLGVNFLFGEIKERVLKEKIFP